MTMTTADLPAVAAVADDGAVSPRAARPRRRSFTAVYKLRMLAEYEAAQPGERTNRPCAMDDVYAAYQAEAPAQRTAAIQAREVGRAALHGDAHQQVRNILAHRVRVAAAGKAKQVRAENAAYAEFIAWARGR